MPEADSVCLRKTDELWRFETAYTVYESEEARPGLVSPILACEKGNDFVKKLIEELRKFKPSGLDKAWKTTGNLFVAKMLGNIQNSVIVFPSHYFIPRHFTGIEYKGNGPIYANQLFGETTNKYAKLSFMKRVKRIKGRLRSAIYRKIIK
jgi:hypothetical protein